MPWWCSLASMLRVPNRIANAASSSAHHSALSVPTARSPRPMACPHSTPTDIATALNCRARYGTTAITAMTATSAASPCDLPKRAPMKSAMEVMFRWPRHLHQSTQQAEAEHEQQDRARGRSAGSRVRRAPRCPPRRRTSMTSSTPPAPGCRRSAAAWAGGDTAVAGRRHRPPGTAAPHTAAKPATATNPGSRTFSPAGRGPPKRRITPLARQRKASSLCPNAVDGTMHE